jgi:hypothetical protein
VRNQQVESFSIKAKQKFKTKDHIGVHTKRALIKYFFPYFKQFLANFPTDAATKRFSAEHKYDQTSQRNLINVEKNHYGCLCS